MQSRRQKLAKRQESRSTVSAGNQIPPRITKRFLTFDGPIRRPRTLNLRIMLCGLVNEGAKEITILFSSEGGSIEDGSALYTYLKALPVELTMHAVRCVRSIAVPIFLAAQNRYASKNARFYFHGYTWTTGMPETMSLETLEERTLLLEASVAWSKNVVKATTKLTDEDFEAMQLLSRPRIFTTAECVQWGIVSEICEPKMLAETDPRVVS